MTRRYHEAVEVQERPRGVDHALDITTGSTIADDTDTDGTDGGSAVESAPSAFLWRGRLYVVREVLDHWHERRAWWRDALDPTTAEPVVPGPDRLEREVWRVVASAGRHRGSGVYDLAGGRPGHPWHLVRVAD